MPLQKHVDQRVNNAAAHGGGGKRSGGDGAGSGGPLCATRAIPIRMAVMVAVVMAVRPHRIGLLCHTRGGCRTLAALAQLQQQKTVSNEKRNNG